MRAVLAAVLGSIAVVVLARRARRYAVADRLRSRTALREPRRMLPAGVGSRIAPRLDAAALDLSVEQAVSTWALAFVVAALLGTALGGLPLATLAGIAVGAGVPITVYGLRHRRRRQVAAAVPVALDRIGAELRAGGTFATALNALAASDSPLAPDLAQVELRIRLGAPPGDALAAWAAARPAPGVAAAAGALALCATAGGRAADALEGLASSLRDRLGVAAEASALSAQARMSALVIGGVPFAYLAWSAMVDPEGLAAATGSAAGRACFAAGAVLELLGLWWMRRIVASGAEL